MRQTATAMEKSNRNECDILKSAQFLKMYCALIGSFTPEEVMFMVYMADLINLRNKGYNTIRSKREHMTNTGIGLRVFDKCVAKTERMGLLERIPVNGMYDYVWKLDAYRRLLNMLADIKIPAHRSNFCKYFFDRREKSVFSISEDEIKAWKGKIQ